MTLDIFVYPAERVQASASLVLVRTAGCRVVLGAALLSRASAAQAPVPLTFEVLPECPARAWFEAQLMDIAGLMAASEAWQLEVEVARVPNGRVRGRLALERRPGVTPRSGANEEMYTPVFSRSIEGAECGEVLAALAMSVDLHLEHRWLTEAPATSAPTNSAATDPAQLTEGKPLGGAQTLNSVAPPSRLSDAGDWALGFVAGGHLRSHLGPNPDFAAQVGLGIHARAEDIAQYYAVLLTTGAAASAELPPEFGNLSWRHGWWTLGAQGCRWSVPLTSWLWLEPCAALHAGRYEAEIIRGSSNIKWFGLAELSARLGMGGRRWAGRLELGGIAPIGSLSMRRGGEVFYNQGLGVLAGLSVVVAPFNL